MGTFGQQAGYPALILLDSSDPARIQAIEAQLDLARTLFIIAGKSGSTVETDAASGYFYQLVVSRFGSEQAGQHFMAITDPASPLAEHAEAHGYRDLFLNPPNMGGRYAAMSYFGLVPAALMGLDLPRLLASAERMLNAMRSVIPETGHPGIWLGAYLGHLAQHGLDKLVLLTSPELDAFVPGPSNWWPPAWVKKAVASSR
ncbi:MAG: hypothetical protein HC915_08265 [Anaerolineae bacterium]|nr:hypothetical protein [Anaerolineae bacterium]